MHEIQLFLAFVAYITQDQYLPQRKAILDLLWGLIVARSPRLSEIARAIRPARAIDVAKRLSRNLRSPRWRQGLLRARLLTLIGMLAMADDGAGVVVAIDDTHLPKPHAQLDSPRGQQHAYPIHDPAGGTVVGYHIAEINVSLSDGVDLPAAVEPWSEAMPGYTSPWAVARHLIESVAPHVGPGAIWVGDRGYDANQMFEVLDDAGVGWCIRLKAGSTRKVVTTDGELLRLTDLWPLIARRVRVSVEGSHHRKGRDEVLVGSRQVHLNGSSPVASKSRSIVVVDARTTQASEPWVLLTSRPVRTKDELTAIVDAYTRRWTVETGHRRQKNARGWGTSLGQIQILNFEALKRLITLIQAVHVFLGLIEAHRPALGTHLIKGLGVKKKVGKDRLYRLFRGFSLRLSRARRGAWKRWTTLRLPAYMTREER